MRTRWGPFQQFGPNEDQVLNWGPSPQLRTYMQQLFLRGHQSNWGWPNFGAVHKKLISITVQVFISWMKGSFQKKNIVLFSATTGCHTILMLTKNTGSYFSALCRLLRKVDRPQSQFYSVPQEFRLTAKLDWLEKSGLWKTLNIKGGPNSQKGPQKDLGPLQGIHLSEISLNSRQIECRDEIM